MTVRPTPAGAGGRRLVVAGTDTNVGKTVFCAALAGALRGYYWKPVQSGLEPGATDAETVLRLSGLAKAHILPEAYRLRMPAAPSLSAAAEDIEIDRRRLEHVPQVPDGRALVIETAGGLLVPMAPGLLQIDLIGSWAGSPFTRASVVLVARTKLGTINHTLLSLEALRARDLPILGVAFVGGPEPAAEAEIVRFGRVRRLGRLPWIPQLDAPSLAAAFAASFQLEEFAP